MSTNILPFLPKTNQPSMIDCVSNFDFLQAIFDLSSENKPMVASISGDPTGAKYPAKPVIDEYEPVIGTARNTYFSLATYTPADDIYRRTKKQFFAVHAIMLDDCGTKVSFDAITLQPSWIIETSAGNHQCGYILREPVLDGDHADRVLSALIGRGLSDPGANGVQSRLARLPVGINGKQKHCADGTPWRVRLVEWNPNLRYLLAEIIDGFGLVLPQTQKTKKPIKTMACIESVHKPRHAVNPVILALQEKGLYKQELSEGKHDIRCPWFEQHTDSNDTGAAYFEPSNDFPRGGFKCQHSHGETLSLKNLLDFLGINSIDAKNLPVLTVAKGESHRLVDSSLQILSDSGEVWDRGGCLVALTHDSGALKSHALSRADVYLRLARLAVWQVYDKKSEDYAAVDPSDKVVNLLYESTAYDGLPALNGIVEQPFFYNGELITQAGYHSDSGIYADHTGIAIESLDDDGAENIMLEIADLLSEFSFASRSDLAAAISAILTACVRGSLKVAPMFLINAHAPGTGKSFLCQLIATFCSRGQRSSHAFTDDDSELRKTLIAELLESPRVIEFDNLTTDLLPVKSLCTMLTSEFLSGRILGSTKVVSVKTNTLVLASGNNVAPIRDMVRRCVVINLDAKTENPEQRSFTKNPVNIVVNNRDVWVAKCLRLIEFFLKKDMADSAIVDIPSFKIKPLAGFDAWSSHCRDPVFYYMGADPCETMRDPRVIDTHRETLRELLTLWFARFGSTGLQVRDLLKRLSFVDDADFLDVLKEVGTDRGSDVIRSKKLGWFFSKNVGIVIDGLRLGVDTKSKRSVWFVEKIS